MLDRRGFTVYRSRSRRTAGVGRLLAACAVGVCSAAAVMAPAIDHRFQGRNSDQPRLRAADGGDGAAADQVGRRLSDLGFPIPTRPDERTARGFPIRAGEAWDTREVGCLADYALRRIAMFYAERTLRAQCGSDDGYRACRTLALYLQILAAPLSGPPMHWLGDHQIGQWAWLFRGGHAGWRTLESSVERGRTAREHWDVHRGMAAGFTINALGFTEYTQTSGGVTHYCSSSGSDANDGLTPATPLLTPGLAASRMRTGFDDWCLFKAGDSFADDGSGSTNSAGPANIASFGNKRGLDALNPMRFDRYGAGARPRFDIKQKDQWIQCRIGTARVHIGSLELWSSTNVGTGTQMQGVTLSDNFTDGRIENCYIHDMSTGISVANGAGHADRCTLRRNIIQNCFYISLPQVGAGIFCQGFTEGLLIEENLIDHNGWHPTVPGAVKNNTRHNLYVTDTNQGYTCRRNISTRASNHGLGRCHGKVYHNVVQDCPTGVLFAEDASHLSGVPDELYQNSIIGRTDDDSAYGISAYIGVQASTTETLLDIYDNTVAGYAVDGTTITVYGMALSAVATVGGTLRCRSNCFSNVHNTSNVPTAVIRFDAGSRTHQLTNNKFSTTGQMVWQFGSLATAGYTFTAAGNQYSNPSGVANTFYTQAGGFRTYAQWVADIGETGSSFADPAFTAPARSLITYNTEVLGGVGTLSAAVTRLQAYDSDTWTDVEHGVYPRLNHIRAGFGMAAVDDPWEGAGEPPPPPPGGGDATPVLPGLWPPPNPAIAGDSYWGADGEWHDIGALAVAIVEATDPDPDIAEILRQVNGAVMPLLEAVLAELRVSSTLAAQAANSSEDLDRLRADAAAAGTGLDLGASLLGELSTLNQLLALLGNTPIVPSVSPSGLIPVGPKTSAYAVQYGELARFDTTAGVLSCRLPPATSLLGTILGAKNVGAAGNAVTITPYGSDTCDVASLTDAVTATLMIVAPGRWEAY